MKTKELIKELLENDPSGELEVTVGKTPIHFIEVKPAYWDGCLQILERDETNPFYNITGGIITTKGDHLCIHELSIRDAILNDADLPVKLIMEDVDCWRGRYSAEVEEWRLESREITKETEEWMKAKEGEKPVVRPEATPSILAASAKIVIAPRELTVDEKAEERKRAKEGLATFTKWFEEGCK